VPAPVPPAPIRQAPRACRPAPRRRHRHKRPPCHSVQVPAAHGASGPQSG
jgi:hypothetical protein